MKLINTVLKDKTKISYGSTICIGFFDGVHKMHKKILEKGKQISKESNTDFIVVTFDQKVLQFLNGEKNHLMEKKEKYDFIENNYDPAFILEIQVNNETIKTTYEEFILFLKEILNVKNIIVGSDFKFGYKALGNVDILKENFQNVFVFERDFSISSTILRSKIT